MTSAQNEPKRASRTCFLICLILMLLTAAIKVVRYAILCKSYPVGFLVMAAVEILLVLAAEAAFAFDLPVFLLADAVACFVLGFTTNYGPYRPFNIDFYIQMAVAACGFLAGTFLLLKEKKPASAGEVLKALFPVSGMRLTSYRKGVLIRAICIPAALLLFWGGSWITARGHKSMQPEIWCVPSLYDEACSEAGTVEKISYETKAYATDERSLTKDAYVYTPYGYDPEKDYNILYLMHGTGENEATWLVEYQKNTNMIDNLIDRGEIEPLIIVTPTFYVENDCADDLDQLTWSFAQELRNDLMPFVESRYSTWAETADEAGFKASRDHRAFAGLSRGAVTTFHSAFMGSLDYISWYGTFSGSRTTGEQLSAAIDAAETADLDIHYHYVSTGSFDFALPQQIKDYQGETALVSRITEGQNSNFDVFPMRYHSMGSWHIALYNFLQKIF